jgi:hypothetical protein
MTRGARTCVAAVLLLPLAACFNTRGKWTYPSGRYPTAESDRPSDASVAVERFLDLRSETNRSFIAWAYVPLSPGGWTHFDRAEATEEADFMPKYWMDPGQDLAKSIVTELRRENVVQRAKYLPDGPESGFTHVLRGKLRTFYAHESRWTYFVSVNAIFLWGLGLPVGRSENGFRVDLELVDLRDGHVAWTGSVYDADDHIEGFYYGPEWYRFSWMWERRLREKLGEIATALGAGTVPLPPRLKADLGETPLMPKCLGVDSPTPCTLH